MRLNLGIPAALAAGLVLASCGADDAQSQAVDGPDVLASFYPLAFVAERVAGPDANVTNLTQPGGEPHDLELTGQQVAQIADADLVVYLAGFQPAVDEAVDQNAADQAVDVLGLVDVLEGDGDDHDDEAGGEDEDSHEEEDDHDLAGDPHIWQDPANMARIAESVADQLAAIAPDEADDFQTRARELVAELDELDAEYQERLSNCERNLVVTSHDAFGYLANRYQLEMLGIAGLEPDADPSPARLADVQLVVETEGVTTIFYERLVSPAVAESLASDLGVETAVLDPVEGLTDDTADEDYLSLMRANLDALEEANGCS
jgi:zinc transport system substrate-binding protein